jgi:predicted TIM-barrel fold metal-dependent hydrolase
LPSTSELDAPTAQAATDRGAIDCDLWAYKPSYSDLAPFLSDSWRHWLRIGEPATPGVRIMLPESQYFIAGSALTSADSQDAVVAALRSHLDRADLAHAIFNPGAASSVSGLSSPLLASEVARAVNEWTAATWLEADERLRGSIVVSAREPARAAAEIRRAGADGRMVQVLLAYPTELLGHRTLDPIYEAAVELGLPVNLQAGGDFSGTNGGVARFGVPGGSRLEAVVAWGYGAQPHLANLVLGDTLAKFPELRVVLNGFGAAWLPALLWRLDMEVADAQIEMPRQLTRLPSELVSTHVRLTTSTLEIPAEPQLLAMHLDSVGGRDLLLFGTGPRRSAGSAPAAALGALPEAWQEAVGAENARGFYPRLAP